jgi:hypothetical protein
MRRALGGLATTLRACVANACHRLIQGRAGNSAPMEETSPEHSRVLFSAGGSRGGVRANQAKA